MILGVGSVTLTDLNDALISGVAPLNPEPGALWIDDSGATNILKVWRNGRWEIETLDVSSLDPDLSEKVITITETLGTISNDKLLNFNDRKIILDNIGVIIGRIPSTSTGLVYPASLPDYTVLDSSGTGTFAAVRRTAVDAGVAKTNGAYIGLQNAYEALNTYLSSHNPRPWDITTSNKNTIIELTSADTFRQKWLDYYLAEAELSVITEATAKQAAKDYADEMYEKATSDTRAIQSGNPILTDKADNANVHVEVDGKSEQNSGSGINLMPALEHWVLKGGARLENGVLYIPSDSSARASVVYKWEGVGTPTYSFDVIKGGNWHGSANYKDITNTIAATEATGTWTSNGYTGVLTPNERKTATAQKLNENVGYVAFEFTGTTAYVKEEYAVTNVMVSKTSTVYEPPVPSPDYPIPIKNLDKSFDIVSSVGGRNLMRYSSQGYYQGGKSFQEHERLVIDGKEALAFTNLNDSLYLNSNDAPNLPTGETFTFSFYAKTSKPLILKSVYMNSSNGGNMKNTQITTEWERYSFSFTSKGDTGTRVHFYPTIKNADGTYETFYLADWKLEESSVLTPHSPAPEVIHYNTQTPTIYKTNILLSEPLRSVGDVKDRLFLDEKDGEWKVERKVREYELKGTIGLETRHVDLGYVQGNMVIPLAKRGNSNIGLSSSFKVIAPSDTTSNTYDGEGINLGNSYSVARVRINSMLRLGKTAESATTADFTSWLASNPITVLYELATPIIETLPQSEQVKLNNIQSFKGSNYVYTVDKGGVVPELHGTFKSSGWYNDYKLTKDLKEVSEAADALKNFTDDAFSDGIIERAEAKAIAEHLNTLKKENEDLTNQYNGIYANTLLTGTPKTNLNSAKTAYNTAYANLTTSINTAILGNKTTPAQKKDVDAKFTAYSSALKLLTQRMNEALTTISGKQAVDAADAIDVGGINLIPNTKTMGAGITVAGVVSGEYQGLAIAKSTRGTTGYLDTFAVRTTGIPTESTYTASFFAKANVNTAINCFFYSPSTTTSSKNSTGHTSTSNDGSSSLNITTEWKRYWVTWTQTVPTGTKSIIIGRNSSVSGAIVEIAGVKFEKGNKATDYSEAPEDADARLEEKTGAPIRYVRDWLNGSSTHPTATNIWTELQVWAKGRNISKGLTPTGSGSLLNPKNITDGDMGTTGNIAVTAGAESHWVQIDLGEVRYDIDEVMVGHYFSDGRTYNGTKTEVSADGENWVTLFDSAYEGAYPETAEGKTYTTELVERMRILTSRVSDALIAINPDNITQTVMSQETFVNWKESVDSKADGETVDGMKTQLDEVDGITRTTETTVSDLVQTSKDWTISLTSLEEVVGAHGTTVNDVTSYMQFRDTGLEIGKSDSQMKVNISNEQIDFKDGDVAVAYINSQTLFIENAKIVETLIIGNHEIKKYPGSDSFTVINWVGS